jgi:hypothetical protein
MKRSEMLGKIAAVIINYNEPHRYTDRDTAIEIAETILITIQRNGMLPPESNRSGKYMLFDLEHVRYAHIWDEDDFMSFENEE